MSAKKNNNLQTISQQRAKHALDGVNNWRDKDGEADIQRHIIGMPAMILMSGFGQTCAFYKSKKEHHERILNQLGNWLEKQQIFSSNDVMREIVHCDAKNYQLAQAETLEYLNWLKKFAKAYLKGDE